MSEETILATEVGLARNEILTEQGLAELIRTGPKRKMKKMPEAQVTQAQATPQPEAPTAPEPPKDPWEQAGYTPVYRSLIDHFEGLRESHLLPVDVRQLIRTTEEAGTVEDFDRFSESQLAGIIDTIRSRMPRIAQEVANFIQTLNRANPMIIETDFI